MYVLDALKAHPTLGVRSVIPAVNIDLSHIWKIDFKTAYLGNEPAKHNFKQLCF
jgi:hypothetical protein